MATATHRVDSFVVNRLRSANNSLENAIESYVSGDESLKRIESNIRRALLILKDTRSTIIQSKDY